MDETVDIFICTSHHHHHVFPAALYSALTQTFSKVRVILFLDGIHPLLESQVKKWWYTESEGPQEVYAPQSGSNTLKKDTIRIEHCKRGILVRNLSGPAGAANVARQWIFEWPDKSPLVKMLDADDIMTPLGIYFMLKYLKPELDGVFCPMLRGSSYKLSGMHEIIPGVPRRNNYGSGCMLLRREFMDKVVQSGFVWPAVNNNDDYFMDIIEKGNFKFATTAENLIYIYLR
jgi:cellulose synthase/poly-beta-1,6-N-acetylglucosamine synthase-like glycosyltransferase